MQDSRPIDAGGLGPLGLLAPTWLAQSDGSPLPWQPGTRLVLPLAPLLSSSKRATAGVAELVPPSRIADALAELHRRPELLLFLRRLRSLVVRLPPGAGGAGEPGMDLQLRRFADAPLRTDAPSCGPAVATVQASSARDGGGPAVIASHRWLLHHATTLLSTAPPGVAPPAALASADASTTLTLAFALGGANDAQPALLFAFLPVARFGLRFTLNADWVLSTTREALLSGHSWNRWLALDLLPAAFIAARETMLLAAAAGALHTSSVRSGVPIDTAATELAAGVSWLRAMPIAAELRSQHDGGLFAGSAAAVVAAARALPCLPCLGGGWVAPERAVAVSGAALSSLGIRPSELLAKLAAAGVTSSMVSAALGLEIIDPEAGVPERVLTELRVPAWRTSVREHLRFFERHRGATEILR